MIMQSNSSANMRSTPGSTVDPAEIAKFSKLSDEWWDPNGKMAPLHRINPLRLTYIRDAACRKFERNVKSLNCLSGLRILDIGCGAGLLCEPFTRLGAQVIGGCCGTTPAQIAAIRGAIDENRTAHAAPRARGEQRHDPLPPSSEQPTELQRLLAAGEFVVSVQLDPPLGGNADGLIDAARRIKDSGLANFVDVNDNPRARARMSGMMASVAIQRAAGIEVIPHLTPRDSTLTGLESTLLGAHAEGVRNVLAVTGDAPEAGDYPGTGSVYDVDAIGLVELIARLNEGTDFHGRAIDGPTSFFPGVAVNPTADDLGLEAERFARKLEAGARWAMTQIVFDMSYLESFLDRIGGSPVPLLVGVWPIRSLELAVRVHNETPGIVVPEHVQERYRAAGADAAGVGAELVRELVAQARELAAGIYVVAPFRRPLGVLDLLETL